MSKTKLDTTYKADEEMLTVTIYAGSREVYKLQCINRVHFYTVAYAAQKMQEGENPDHSLFKRL